MTIIALAYWIASCTGSAGSWLRSMDGSGFREAESRRREETLFDRQPGTAKRKDGYHEASSPFSILPCHASCTMNSLIGPFGHHKLFYPVLLYFTNNVQRYVIHLPTLITVLKYCSRAQQRTSRQFLIARLRTYYPRNTRLTYVRSKKHYDDIENSKIYSVRT